MAVSSFKQQCPTCGAMVGIRDAKFVGRKMGCPKCGDKFVVEAPAEESTDDEAPATPAAKAKPAANGAIKKAPGKDAADAKTKPDAKEAPAEKDKEASDEKPDKEKAAKDKPAKEKKKAAKKPATDPGKKKLLLIGLGVGVVALGGLVWLGMSFFGGGGDNKKKPDRVTQNSGPAKPPVVTPTGPARPPGSTPGGKPPGSFPQTNPGGKPPGTNPGGKPPDTSKAEDPKSRIAKDITNLLPNDTRLLVSIAVEKLGTTAVKTAAIRPGAFNTEGFHKTFGFAVDEVTRILQASNPAEDWVFSVMRTTKPVAKADLVKQLQLGSPTTVNGLDMYTIEKPLDSLSNLLLKGNRKRDHFTLHIIDEKTLVFADAAPMKKFLEDKEKPKYLTDPPEPPVPGAPPPKRPRRGGKGPTPPPGGHTGPGTPPGGMQGGTHPPMGMQGGTHPPMGMQGGTPPPMGGMTGLPGPGNPKLPPSTPVELPASYLTVPRELKEVLDEVENEDSTILFLIAGDNSILSHLAAKRSSGRPALRLPDPIRDLAFKEVGDTKVFAVAVKSLSDAKAALSLSLYMNDEDKAKELEKDVGDAVRRVISGSRLDLAEEVIAKDVPPGTRPPGGNPPPGSFVGTPPGGQMGRPPGSPPGGTRPGDKHPGKDGTWSVESWDQVVTINVKLNWKAAIYETLVRDLRGAMIWVRGQAELADTRARVHDLADALQAYVKEKGTFPRGTAVRKVDPNRVLDWRPDQRLSWLAELLPYVGKGAFNAVALDPQKSWTDEPNLSSAVVPVPQFLATRWSANAPPFLGYPGQSGIFAATHFVGVAGVGGDAAEYANEDPATVNKRGVFGYNRVTRKEDITDPLENTIAVLMVPASEAGPWIAGGGSTVRGVTEEPDCIQPFVCVEYKGQRGTIAVMCDGKVRFIPESIEPEMFRAMCTISGGETVRQLNRIAPIIEAEGATQVRADATPPPSPVEEPKTVPAPKAPGGDAAKEPIAPTETPKPPTPPKRGDGR
jgi:hypothetical protein